MLCQYQTVNFISFYNFCFIFFFNCSSTILYLLLQIGLLEKNPNQKTQYDMDNLIADLY